jgi:TRAP transporter TAXI family solute receptor
MSISALLIGRVHAAQLILCSLLCILVNTSTCYAYDILLGTGSTETFSYFAGKRICHSINSFSSDVTCRPVPMQNYAASLTNLEGGALDIALVNAKIIHDASNNKNMFQFLDIDYNNLRLLMPLYKEPIVLVVRQDSGIASLDDLVGKRINGGPAFTMQNLVFHEVMSIKGWDKDDFKNYQALSSVHAEDAIAFNAGTVQVNIHYGMHPDSKIAHELSGGPGELIGIYDSSIEQLIDSQTGFTSYAVPSGCYAKQNENIRTLALENLLITSVDTDQEIITLILDAIIQAKKQLQTAHTALLDEELNAEMLKNRYLEPHPAAAKYFQ